MAQVYERLTGKTGVAITTSGPGVGHSPKYPFDGNYGPDSPV